MKKLSLFTALLFTIFTFVSCEDKLQEDIVPSSGTAISIYGHVGEFTKATDISFEIDDEIGVIIKKTNSSSLFLNNQKFTYTESGFTPETEQKWYTGEETATVMAYYPYKQEYNAIFTTDVAADFTVQSDQSTHEGYTASDLMTAIVDDVVPSANKVSLQFYHKLSKVIINVNNNTNGTIGDVFFSDIKGKFSWNFETITPIDGVGSIKSVKLLTPATGYTNSYALIVPPQTATPTIAILIDGKQYNFTAKQAYTFTSGKKRAVNIVIDEASISVTFDNIVNDWTEDEDMNFEQNLAPDPDPSPALGTVISCDKDIDFKLVSCEVSGTTAIVNFTIRNNGENIKAFRMNAGRSLNIFDDLGNTYSESYPKLILGDDETTSQISIPFTSGDMLKGSIHISDFNSSVTSLQHMTIPCHTFGSSWEFGSESIILKDVIIRSTTPEPEPEHNPALGTLTSCDKNIDIKLVSCEVSGSTAMVNFTITNNGENINAFRMNAGRSLDVFDDLGNTYSESYPKLMLGDYETTSQISMAFPSGVMMKGSIHISDFNSRVTSLQHVTIPCHTFGSSWEFGSESFVLKNVIIRSTTPEPEPEHNAALGTLTSCDKDIDFKLVSCEVSGSTAMVNFTITNNGENIKEFRMNAGRSLDIFDDLGNTYSESYPKLMLGDYETTSQISMAFPSGVMMKGSIHISDFNSSVTSLQHVTIPCQTFGSSWEFGSESVVLKNVIIRSTTPELEPEHNPALGTLASFDKNIDIKLVSCEVSGSTAIVNFTITNNGENINTFRMRAGNSITILDNLNNAYTDSYPELKLGDYTTTSQISMAFPSGVMMKGSIHISDFNSSATSLQQMTIPCYTFNSSWEFGSENITFSNVTIR